MQPWTTSDAEQLAEVHLGSGAASTVAWCPVNGLLAVGARRHAKMACVHIISPHCLEHKVTLAVPLQGPEDGLVCVTWSPAGCRRVLLTATRSGAVAAWTQQPPGRNSKQPDMQLSPIVTIRDWWCHSVGQLIPQQHSTPAAAGQQQQQPAQEYILSMQWLQPPSCWPYNNRVLQEHDFHAGSVPNMFAPAAAQSRPAPVKPEGGPQAETDGDIHWVQPGTLAFAAVLSSGRAAVGWATWGLHGQLRWQVTPSLTLLPAAPGVAVLAADATWSVGGIAVALATQQQPDKVQVVELQGNPLHHQCLGPGLRNVQPVFQVQPLAAASIAAGAPCSILSLSWDPHSSGQKLAAATHSSPSSSSSSGPGHVTLLSLAMQQGVPGSPPYRLSAVTAAQVAQAPGPQQYAWLLDGLLVGQQLLDAATLVPLPLKFPQSTSGGVLQQQQQNGEQCAPPDALQSVAASPHRVAVAVVQSASSPEQQQSSSCRLLLYSIPPVSKAAAGGEVAPTLAGRLVWSLLLQRHNWDVVQHLLHAVQPQLKAAQPAVGAPSSTTSAQGSAAAREAAEIQAQRVGQVLALVDNKLCVQADEVYSMHAARWDALKYAVVSHTPGSEARALSIDLRLRLMVALFEQHLAAAMREEELRQGQQSQQQASSSGPGSAASLQLGAAAATIATLAELALAIVDFEVCCVATWLHRRAAAAASAGGNAAAAAAEASVRAVPCIRNMLDMRSNSKLATVWTKASELVKLSKVSRAFSAWKLLHKPMTGQAEAPQNWEDMLPGVIRGAFQLHPSTQPRNFPVCLINFALPTDQLLRHLHSVAEWQQVPVLTDADITARATRLGLLPAKTLEARALYARQVLMHSSFRRDVPYASLSDPAATGAAAAAAGMPGAAAAAGKREAPPTGPTEEVAAAAKRRRWDQQVQECMGSTNGVSTVCSSQVVDVVHMAWASPSALSLQSVDGSVLCRDDAGQVQGGGDARAAARRPGLSSLYTWAYACPITGQMWMPANV